MAKVETKTTAKAAEREVQIPRGGNENGAGITGLLRSFVKIIGAVVVNRLELGP